MIIFLENLSYEEKNFIEDLYRREKVFLYRLAYGILNNKDLAEDALSACFIKIMEDIDRVSSLPESSLRPYCLTILKNEAINILRREMRLVYTDQAEKLLIENLENQIEKDLIIKDQVESLLYKNQVLTDEERDFIIFRYKHDLTYKEIGKLMGISEATATKRNQRILEKIRKTQKGGKDND